MSHEKKEEGIQKEKMKNKMKKGKQKEELKRK
jgi:hypothetical protein